MAQSPSSAGARREAPSAQSRVCFGRLYRSEVLARELLDTTRDLWERVRALSAADPCELEVAERSLMHGVRLALDVAVWRRGCPSPRQPSPAGDVRRGELVTAAAEVDSRARPSAPSEVALVAGSRPPRSPLPLERESSTLECSASRSWDAACDSAELESSVVALFPGHRERVAAVLKRMDSNPTYLFVTRDVFVRALGSDRQWASTLFDRWLQLVPWSRIFGTPGDRSICVVIEELEYK